MKTNKVFLFLIVLQVGLFGQTSWEETGLSPYPLRGGEAVEFNSDIFILGGYLDSLKDNINIIQRFRPYEAVNNLIQYGSMMNASSHLIAGIYKNKIYVCGSLFASLDTLNWGKGFIEALEPTDTNIISSVIDTNFNFYKPFSTGLIKDSIIYLIGGLGYPTTLSDNVKFPFIVEYNIEQKSKTFQMDSLPNSSILPYNQMAANIGDTIYIFGGIQSTVSKEIFKYVTTTHTFEKLPIELKIPRAGGRAVKIPNENKIIIIGGFNETSVALRSTEFFDLTPGGYEISSGPSLNIGRQQFAAVSYSETVYVFGGIGQFNNSIYEYERLGIYMTDVENESNIPHSLLLHQNFPNPFNPSTKIKIEIGINLSSKQSHSVELKIYDILGREVVTLFDGQKESGIYVYDFNGKSDKGIPLSSGLYFYRLKVDNLVQTRKMILTK